MEDEKEAGFARGKKPLTRETTSRKAFEKAALLRAASSFTEKSSKSLYK